jgi:hypothetical protein
MSGRSGRAAAGRPENHLLFSALQLRRPSGSVGLIGPELDWDYVIRAAECQGITPLLWESLRLAPDGTVPAEASSRLRNGYWASHFRARRLLAELDRIGGEAQSAGIAVMPLKGAALAGRCYPRPALRPMSDLDLLVPADQLASFGAMLEGQGYRNFSRTVSYAPDHRLLPASDEHQFVRYDADLAITVEFRAEPLEPAVGRLADLDDNLASSLQAHIRDIWSRARGQAASAAGLHAMSREDLILHVAAHLAARHAEFRLIWLHDLARLADTSDAIDWCRMASAARRFRIDGPVRTALSAAVRYAGATIPTAVLAEFGDEHTNRTALGRWEYRRLAGHADALGSADLTREGPCLWRFAAGLSRVSGWGPRFRAARWAILPARSYLTHWREPDAGRPRLLDYGLAFVSRYAAMAMRVGRGEAVRPWRAAPRLRVRDQR